MVHTYNEILFSHKRMKFCYLQQYCEVIILSEMSQTKKNKYYVIWYAESEKLTSRKVGIELWLPEFEEGKGERGIANRFIGRY